MSTRRLLAGYEESTFCLDFWSKRKFRLLISSCKRFPVLASNSFHNKFLVSRPTLKTYLYLLEIVSELPSGLRSFRNLEFLKLGLRAFSSELCDPRQRVGMEKTLTNALLHLIDFQ